jgi:flagellar biosynthesis protein FliP
VSNMRKRKWLICLISIGVFLMLCSSVALATPGISISENGLTIQSTDDPAEIANSVKLLLILTLLSLLPSILIMMTSFTRIIVVLSFLRNSMGTQQAPPNQVMIGLALFLTLFVMMPTFTQLNNEALQPFTDGEIAVEEALDKSSDIMKEFMISQTYDKDLALFAGMAKLEQPDRLVDLPLTVVTPAFMISELKKAFQMGFMLYIPFLVIDMVVASTLMAMGMMMLPPVMISLPFKILLFLLIDGWNLIADILVRSFVR